MDDAGNEGEARRASSSSSGGGGLPVKPVKRLSQAASDSSGDSPRRGASPREAEDRRKPHGKTATEAIQAIPQRRRGASEETSSPSVSRTPSRGKKLLNGNDRTPSPKEGASKGARALSARGERSNTSPETTEQKAQSRPASTSPLRGMHVRSASPVASTKCSKEREKIGRARAAAAGVKKPPVEAPKSVTGSFLLEQSLASKELLNKQRKEWMAAVKRTQDSTAKYVAQKRIAATNPSVASEAHERAQLIRRAQEDNWQLHVASIIRAFSDGADDSCGGDALRTRISNPGQMLLRQDAKLDEPDKFGVKKPFPSWGRVDLLLRNVDGVTDYMRSRDVERMRKIKQGQQDEINQYGLPQEVLMWVYGMGRRRLMEELNQRQCHHKVISCIDVQGLREALIEELQNDQAYSPTRQGVTPGVIQKLSTEEFQKERAADTPVPLLLAVVDERSPRHLRFREHLEAAARLLLRSIRVVLVDATQEPEVVRDFSTTRFPTLIWMKGHSGVELAREIGILPATSIVDRTKVLLRLKELPEPEKEASALLAKAGPVSRKIRTSNFERAYPDKHAAVRSLKGHSKGFWRHGRR
ncbi:Uncharacterized protein SCF082_LOCUS44891 [Durusdinium trenchii]|uniref:Uncharacterized protein n=1 Tax=Durusdinium trenchii TaxID=1381693 RepID=A0ABP0R4U8_9DINO